MCPPSAPDILLNTFNAARASPARPTNFAICCTFPENKFAPASKPADARIIFPVGSLGIVNLGFGCVGCACCLAASENASCGACAGCIFVLLWGAGAGVEALFISARTSGVLNPA